MTNQLVKQELDAWLDQVDYSFLNSSSYVPSEFALTFMNFIKLVNGEVGESNKTPPVHLKMLDKLTSGHRYIANLCHRGLGKTTIFGEYLILYLAIFEALPVVGNVSGLLYVSDSMENGVKSARKNIEFRYNNSEFLQMWIPEVKFTDAYMEFKNRNGTLLGVRMFGSKALSLGTILYTPTGTTTIGECKEGDLIMSADGHPTTIWQKSPIFNDPMYKITLKDGREIKVCEDHLNQVHIKKFKSSKTFTSYTFEEKTLSTKELLEYDLFVQDPNGSNRPLLWIENTKPIHFKENDDLLIDPYTVGLLLGDGSLNTKMDGLTPVVLTAHKDDWPTYEREIPYPLGKPYIVGNTVQRTILGITTSILAHGLNKHGDIKEIPQEYLYSSYQQRLRLLKGLMDSDGTALKSGKCVFSSNSLKLVQQVLWIVRSLGGYGYMTATGKDTHYKCCVELYDNMFYLERKLDRQKKTKKNMVHITSITRIPDEPSQCITISNDSQQFVATEGFVRTHNSGIRGTKIFGKRPTLAILDDLVGDDDAKSRASMEAIKDTVYKGIIHALDPTNNMIIFNGTPFNKMDILLEAVESGAWDVNVWPVCEVFPCTKEEFQGSWEDRFSYESVLEQYNLAEKSGRLSSFYQELMLRITSEDERLVQDSEIHWYKREVLLRNKSNFNFYITTDFATSAKQTADKSVISVWAYSSNADWFWVDGVAEQMTMDKTLDHLFRLVSLYKPQSVGIEITGQQGGFIPWLQNEQIVRNIWFNFANMAGSTQPGIRPTTDKLSRFNLVTPWFKAGKFFFPDEMRRSKIMVDFMGEIRLATHSGLKGKDDCIDTISMLGYLNPWKPSDQIPTTVSSNSVMWDDYEQEEDATRLSSYII